MFWCTWSGILLFALKNRKENREQRVPIKSPRLQNRPWILITPSTQRRLIRIPADRLAWWSGAKTRRRRFLWRYLFSLKHFGWVLKRTSELRAGMRGLRGADARLSGRFVCFWRRSPSCAQPPTKGAGCGKEENTSEFNSPTKRGEIPWLPLTDGINIYNAHDVTCGVAQIGADVRCSGKHGALFAPTQVILLFHLRPLFTPTSVCCT